MLCRALLCVCCVAVAHAYFCYGFCALKTPLVTELSYPAAWRGSKISVDATTDVPIGGAKKRPRPGTTPRTTATLSDKERSIVESREYVENKEALKKDLYEEYGSFFADFASERYLPDVEFNDPVTSFRGLGNYKRNLDMLGGRSLFGSVLFKEAGIVLHRIEEPGPFRLRTRWTLSVCFKALPWQPVAQFTGISDYTLDEWARVVKQDDYWDSINLEENEYKPVATLVGVSDFVGQLLPFGKKASFQRGGRGDANSGALLRRAKGYEVRRFDDGGKGDTVVALRQFSGKASEDKIKLNSLILVKNLRADGLSPASTAPQLQSSSDGQHHKVCVSLLEHDWQ